MAKMNSGSLHGASTSVTPVAAVMCLGVLAAMCSSTEPLNRAGNTDEQGGGYTVPEGYVGSDASTTGKSTVVIFADGGLDDGGEGIALSLECDAGVLLVSGQPKTTQCVLKLEDGSPVPNAVWLVDDTRIGSIGSDGVFRANGFVGGIVKVMAKVGSATVSTEITVDVALRDNSAALSAGDINTLIAGGSGGPNGIGPDGLFRWLYPYDKTVFPQGLPSPSLQFGGSCSGSTYLKITTAHFFYEQFAGATTPIQVTIPEEVWKGITLTAGPADWVNVAVSKLCSGQLTGPVTEAWRIAPGKMKGIVYYTAYASPEFGMSGAIRLRLGSNAEPLLPGCTVCHSVSANGEVLASRKAFPGTSATYDLRNGAAPPPVMATSSDGDTFSFPGLTPDGKRALTSGGPSTRRSTGLSVQGMELARIHI
jgi:hypothetical protein